MGARKREIEEECRRDRDEHVENHTTTTATPLSSSLATRKLGINESVCEDVVVAVKKATVMLGTEA